MVSSLPYGIVFGRAFAPWRLCVKSLLPGGRPQRLAVRDDGAKGQRPCKSGTGPDGPVLPELALAPPQL